MGAEHLLALTLAVASGAPLGPSGSLPLPTALPEPAPSATAPEPPPPTPWWAWTAAGVAVVGALTAVVVLVASDSQGGPSFEPGRGTVGGSY